MTFEFTIAADSWPPFSEQLRLQIYRDVLGFGSSRRRALGRNSGTDQAESAAQPGSGN